MYHLIRVVYDEDCRFILDIVNKYNIEKEFYSLSHYKERKKALPILTRNGTKNVPLIEFVDEEGEESKVIWSETNPNWEQELDKLIPTDDLTISNNL
jgi:hypothetical protein